MKYEVGEVLYLLARKNNKIVPSRVEAIITVKKIAGEEITHELSVPGIDRTTVLEKLDVVPFSSVADLRAHMLSVLEEKIDSEISVVTSLAAEAYRDANIENHLEAVGTSEKKAVDLPPAGYVEETMTIELPDGKTANVILPKELM